MLWCTQVQNVIVMLLWVTTARPHLFGITWHSMSRASSGLCVIWVCQQKTKQNVSSVFFWKLLNTRSATTNTLRHVIFPVFPVFRREKFWQKTHSCMFFPNCTRDHSITYTDNFGILYNKIHNTTRYPCTRRTEKSERMPLKKCYFVQKCIYGPAKLARNCQAIINQHIFYWNNTLFIGQ